VLGVYAGCAAQDAARLAEVTAQQIRALAVGVQLNELARARAQMKAALFMSRESLLARAEHAAGQWLTFGRLPTAAETARAIDAVGADDMARLGDRLLSVGTATVAALGPKPAMNAAAAFSGALFN